MRIILAIAATALAGSLLACSRSQPQADYSSNSLEPSEPMLQAPLRGQDDPGYLPPPPPDGDYSQDYPPPTGPDAYRSRDYAPPPGPDAYGSRDYPPLPGPAYRSRGYSPPPGSYSGAGAAPPGSSRMVWRASPRWAEIRKGDNSPPPRRTKEPDSFEAAREKADDVGVENLTSDDISGLTPEQLKLLRGY